MKASEILLIEPSAEAVAAGGAFAAAAGTLSCIRYNPAGLAKLTRPSLAFTHLSTPSDWTHDWLAGAASEGDWSFGAEAVLSHLAPFDVYDVNGLNSGKADASASSFGLFAASRWWDGNLQAGLGARYFRNKLAEFNNQGYSMDAGLRIENPWIPLALGLCMQNLGKQSAYISQADPLPFQVRPGAEWVFKADPDLSLTLRADWLVKPASLRYTEQRFGAELTLFKDFCLRGGMSRSDGVNQLSGGAGFRLGDARFNYAVVPTELLGMSHWLGLEYAFAPWKD